MKKTNSIYVAGHTGLVGSALLRKLTAENYDNVITRTHKELDLINQDAVNSFFKEQSPEYVFLAAAKVGGIMANSMYPAEFIYQNLMISANVVQASHEYGVKKLLYLGSSCIYPKHAEQPIRESSLLSGPLEPTNAPYALSKIAGIKLCDSYRQQYGSDFISVMPSNLYGPGDNFDLETSHVLAALIRKIHDAKERGSESVIVWGTGKPRREFLHVDDLAEALLFLMQNYSNFGPINVGSGSDISIMELAQILKRTIGFQGAIELDKSKPDGTPRKLLDVSQITRMGWKPEIPLEEGLRSTYDWFLENIAEH